MSRPSNDLVHPTIRTTRINTPLDGAAETASVVAASSMIRERTDGATQRRPRSRWEARLQVATASAAMPVSKGRKKANKRPTPPKNPAVTEVTDKGPSPTWYVATMFGLMAVGIIVILLNYMGILPGGTTNWYLLGGLAMIGMASR